MNKTTYLNNEPFKERVCSSCNKILRETRVRIGKNSLKCYRIWVHKESRKRDCYSIESTSLQDVSTGHKPTCRCGHCNLIREATGR